MLSCSVECNGSSSYVKKKVGSQVLYFGDRFQKLPRLLDFDMLIDIMRVMKKVQQEYTHLLSPTTKVDHKYCLSRTAKNGSDSGKELGSSFRDGVAVLGLVKQHTQSTDHIFVR